MVTATIRRARFYSLEVSMLLRNTTLCCILALALYGPCVMAQQSSSLPDGFFAKKLYPMLEKANCRGCHVENGVAATTRLHFPPESAAQGQVETFGRSLMVLIDREHPGVLRS